MNWLLRICDVPGMMLFLTIALGLLDLAIHARKAIKRRVLMVYGYALLVGGFLFLTVRAVLGKGDSVL